MVEDLLKVEKELMLVGRAFLVVKSLECGIILCNEVVKKYLSFPY